MRLLVQALKSNLHSAAMQLVGTAILLGKPAHSSMPEIPL